jgi:hypothetical protein
VIYIPQDVLFYVFGRWWGARLGPSKRRQKPLFEGKKGFPPNVQYQNVPTEFSFGIGWENNGKIPTDTEPKYQIGVQL